jgi:hypothetical protein
MQSLGEKRWVPTYTLPHLPRSPLLDVKTNLSLTEREDELAMGLKKYQKDKIKTNDFN